MTMTPPSPRVDEQWSALAARLQRCALGLTRSSDKADDLVQETIARLLSRGGEHSEAYAITTLTRLWLAHERSWRRRLALLRRRALPARETRQPDESLDIQARLQRLEIAIAALPPRQRAVLVLRCVEGLDSAAVAAALDCDVQTVRAHLHLARQRLRSMFGESA